MIRVTWRDEISCEEEIFDSRRAFAKNSPFFKKVEKLLPREPSSTVVVFDSANPMEVTVKAEEPEPSKGTE